MIPRLFFGTGSSEVDRLFGKAFIMDYVFVFLWEARIFECLKGKGRAVEVCMSCCVVLCLHRDGGREVGRRNKDDGFCKF